MSGVSHSWLALGFCECLVSFRWGNTCWLDKYCCMEGVDSWSIVSMLGISLRRLKGAVWLCILRLLGKGLDCHIGVKAISG